MQRSAWRSFVYSQLIFYVGLTTCMLLRPAGLAANSGVSYYGTFLNTVTPYTIGLLGAAFFSWQAARGLQSCEWFANSLRAGAFLLIGIVLTPYTASAAFDWLHTTFGSILFIIQLLASARLAFGGPTNWLLRGLWLLELVGGVISALYVVPPHGYLIESQLLFQLAYGSLVLYALHSITFTAKGKAGYGIASKAEAHTK